MAEITDQRKHSPLATDTEVNNWAQNRLFLHGSSTAVNDCNIGAQMTEQPSCFLADK